MNVSLVSVVSFALAITSAANANQYDECADEIAGSKSYLLAPVSQIKKAVIIDDGLAVIVLADGVASDESSLVTIKESYSPGIYESLKEKPTRAWIGIIKGHNGEGRPALWMEVWVATRNKCVNDSIGSLFWEKRTDAPKVFSRVIDMWDRTNSNNTLPSLLKE